MLANITAVGKFLPSKIISNKEFEKTLDTSDQWIVSRTGISERRKLESGKASSYMAIKAIEKIIDNKKLNINDIDLIIVSTITPDMIFPSTACLIQNHFKINNCWGFDLSAACSGFLFALETANSFIKSKKYQKIIVVGVDTMSSILDYEDRNTCILFGDGAGAVLLEASLNYGIVDSELGEIDGISILGFFELINSSKLIEPSIDVLNEIILSILPFFFKSIISETLSDDVIIAFALQSSMTYSTSYGVNIVFTGLITAPTLAMPK